MSTDIERQLSTCRCSSSVRCYCSPSWRV